MANFKVKYVVDGVTKTVEGSRSPLSFNNIRSAIARGAKGSFGLQYTGASGAFFVDNDAALVAALTDAERSRKPYLRFVVTAQGGAGPSQSYSAPAQSYAAPAQSYSAPPAAAPQAYAPPAASRSAAPAGTIAQFTLPGSGSADKIKINPEQTEQAFIFTPVASKYQTEVTVVLEGSKLIYNNTYTFQDGSQLKTMNLTQTFNLPYVPRPDQVVVNNNVVQLLI